MTLALIATGACRDRRDPQAEPPAAAESSGAATSGETANAPEAAVSVESESSSSGTPRSEKERSRRSKSRVRPPAAPTDSPPPSERAEVQLLGTITVVGSAPVTQVQLRVANGGNRTLTGPQLPSLRRVAGLEVTMSGIPTSAGDLMVLGFTVLSADGQPALDGVLEHGGTGLYLRTQNRRVVLGNPPAVLHNHVGARVWLTGSTDTGPNVYGIITPAP